jgi:hypothetical protein
MKKIGTYTIRGQLTETESEVDPNGERIILFDGSFDTGYRVTDFRIWSSSYGSSSEPDVVGKLATEEGLSDGATNFMNAGDNREIAWAASAGSTDGGLGFAEDGVIDPDNMIIEDLYIYVRGSSDTRDVNYMVTMDKYDITDWQGALAMVRNRSQA